jgi:Cu/Ag efflux pump CusA
VVDATIRRARPVALTALAAILGMIPLAGSVFWGPMAITIMGGLLVATVLTLVVVPALYALWFRVRENERSDAPVRFERMERPDEDFVPVRIAAE